MFIICTIINICAIYSLLILSQLLFLFIKIYISVKHNYLFTNSAYIDMFRL